jgi:leader peptidase (prepilin peptidase)/N-methyltransferase
LVLPAIPITLIGQLAACLHVGSWSQLFEALLVAAFSFVFGLWLNFRMNFGMGDVKLSSAIALALGWFHPILGLISFVLGITVAAFISGARLALKKVGMGQSIALGPYLLVGFVLTLPVAYNPGLVIDSTSSALSSWSMVSFSPST